MWASKNALTGAKAGLAADAAQFVEDPNIDNGLQTAISLFPLGPKGYIDPKTQITGLLESVGDVKDLVPAYEDGKGKTINKEDLPPEYRTGTPEYFERQRKISGAVNAVHEISHLADALVNKAHSADATNNYMEYLLDRDNIMSYNEIRQSLMDVNPNTYRYLTTPSENKAHMIQLKRGMQKEGLINNWTDPITQDKIEEYLSYRSKYANRVNPVLRTLYDIRPDKQGFINRMNNLTPIEWAAPLGLPMFFGEEQENK